jgi:hypothetical protein
MHVRQGGSHSSEDSPSHWLEDLKKHRNLPANQTGTLSKAFFFAAIEHLNIAADLIDDPKDRSELIEMNLEAARHCIANGAFSAVELHVKKGIELIQEPWQDEWFTTTLELSKLHAKCLYCTGRFEESIVIAESIVQNATIKSDKAVAFQIIVDSLQATGALDEAFTRGIAFLREMDDVFPVRPSAFHVVRGMAALRRYLHKFADDNLSRTVVCQERVSIRTTKIASVGWLSLYRDQSRKAFGIADSPGSGAICSIWFHTLHGCGICNVWCFACGNGKERGSSSLRNACFQTLGAPQLARGQIPNYHPQLLRDSMARTVRAVVAQSVRGSNQGPT